MKPRVPYDHHDPPAVWMPAAALIAGLLMWAWLIWRML